METRVEYRVVYLNTNGTVVEHVKTTDLDYAERVVEFFNSGNTNMMWIEKRTIVITYGDWEKI